MQIIAASNKVESEGLNPMGNTRQLIISGGYQVSPRLSINGGGELATSSSTVVRHSTTAGTNYRFMKLPFIVGLRSRYSRFQIPGESEWKSIVNGSLDITWQVSYPWEKQKLLK
ncbi:MAG: hypothetical protein EOP51_27715 [Sphingobacteriales bacterium]|nr:MAG: hypothetical protein EOP51_27715 [Sphingobacteriales bacterium]